MDKKVYYTVLLSALLHDIGKLYQRMSRITSLPEASRRYHSELSEEIVNLIVKNWKEKNEVIDIDMLTTIVRYHHERDIASCHINDDRLKSLLWLVSESDNLSSSQREMDGGSKRGSREFRLYSIFADTSELEDKAVDGNRGNNFYNFYEEGIALDFYFWSTPECLSARSKHRYVDDVLKEEFTWMYSPNEIHCSFYHFYNAIYNFLLKTCMFVPDFTQSNCPKTSLFVHLTTTSAIAACMYQFHQIESGRLPSKEEIKDRSRNKYILYKGGLTPIQGFIFDIGPENPKGTAKTLRGRSFLISLFSEAVAISILRRLDLPISNLIQKAGSDFCLLLPNTPRTKGVLKAIEMEVNEFLWTNLLGTLKYVSASLPMAGRDFSHYSVIAKRLGDSYNRNKYRIYVPWDRLDDISTQVYSQAWNKNLCEFCGMFWTLEDSNLCFVCSLAHRFGGELPHNEYICFSDEVNNKGWNILGLSI